MAKVTKKNQKKKVLEAEERPKQQESSGGTNRKRASTTNGNKSKKGKMSNSAHDDAVQIDPKDEMEDEDGSSEDDIDEEDLEDEEVGTDNEGASDMLNTDVEGFPINEEDREGLINLLTQIFLRNAEVPVPEMADVLIEQKFGLVIGPAEEEADDDNTNMVYGMTAIFDVNTKEGKSTDVAQAFVKFIVERANKHAPSNEAKQYSEVLKSNVGFLINERMLHFPAQVVPLSFSSLRNDLDNMKDPYKHVIYIQKIRISEEENADNPTPFQQSTKKKIGKAEKKRLAAAALAKADVIFDNVEDSVLSQIEDGLVYQFDYPVHNDVEAGSKFHIIEKDGKKYKPYRRVVLMDSERFNAFVDRMANYVP